MLADLRVGQAGAGGELVAARLAARARQDSSPCARLSCERCRSARSESTSGRVSSAISCCIAWLTHHVGVPPERHPQCPGHSAPARGAARPRPPASAQVRVIVREPRYTRATPAISGRNASTSSSRARRSRPERRRSAVARPRPEPRAVAEVAQVAGGARLAAEPAVTQPGRQVLIKRARRERLRLQPLALVVGDRGRIPRPSRRTRPPCVAQRHLACWPAWPSPAHDPALRSARCRRLPRDLSASILKRPAGAGATRSRDAPTSRVPAAPRRSANDDEQTYERFTSFRQPRDAER